MTPTGFLGANVQSHLLKGDKWNARGHSVSFAQSTTLDPSVGSSF